MSALQYPHLDFQYQFPIKEPKLLGEMAYSRNEVGII
jgi:hypothetical protein